METPELGRQDPAIVVRPMKFGEISAAAALVERSFEAAIARFYSEAGQAQFRAYANAEAMQSRFDLEHFSLVALAGGPDGEQLVGVIEVRQNEHISLLFVDPGIQRRGVGRALLNQALARMLRARPDLKFVSVNSSPNGVEAYRRFGFEPVEPLQEQNGIRFQPMQLPLGGTAGEAAGRE